MELVVECISTIFFICKNKGDGDVGKEKICGIYCIKNLINNKKYIGLSGNIYSRWDSHKNMLRRNDHFNIFLQRSWNKYGEDNFEFSIIEKCLEEELCDKEIYYIKSHNTNNDKYGYNLSTGGDRPKFDKSVSERYSFTRSKRVLQFTKEGKFIAEYQNARIASEKYKVQDSLIYQCCKGKIKSACGYIWKYKTEYDGLYLDNKVSDIEQYERIFKENPVCQIDLKGNLIKEWGNCLEIGRHYNIAHENIRSCCDKVCGRKTYIGFIWMYSEDYYKNGVDLEYHKVNNFTKPVNQYDLDNNFIATYESAREAEKITGIGYKMISRVCNGGRPYTHGFIWKFAS